MADVDRSPERVRAIARAGYVFLLPLLANYSAMYAEAIDTSSPAFGGGFGRWTHRRAVSLEGDLAARHHTTLVSSSWMDVRAEPWVLSVPIVGSERTRVVTDLWGFVLDEAVDAGPPDRPVVIATQDWVGSIPSDAGGVARAESAFVRCETRARIPESLDPEAARRIEVSYRMEPVSSWSGGPPASPAPTIAWWPVDTDTIVGMSFWSAATFALTLTTASDEDRGILDRLTEIGVAPGAHWEEGALAAELAEAIGEGMDDALNDLMRATAPTGGHTPTRRSRRYMDRDYFTRALAALGTFPLTGPPAGTGPLT
jgi:hypothetical protein